MKRQPLTIPQFIDEELKPFSIGDSFRSIPSLVDGFKPTQRKIVYGMLGRGESAPVEKVEILAATISAKTAYHHGVTSIESTIVGMAQEFTGSNNFNLLVPKGQFGSRLSHEASSPRYIKTTLHENFRKIFKKEDDILLQEQEEEDKIIEPKNYYPIIPFVLLNGAKGIGTGYAVSVLNRNPEQIRKYILAHLKGQKKDTEILPWYNGFQGKIYKNQEGKIQIEGILKVVNTTTIEITELPIGYQLDKYKTVLNGLIDSGFIKDYDDLSTKKEFKFIVKCPRESTAHSHDVLIKKFKLISQFSENFTFWNEENRIKIFKNEIDVLDYFIKFRLQKYEDRRQAQISILKGDLEFNNEKMRFIEYYIENSQIFAKKNKKECIELLQQNKFTYIEELLQLHVYHLTGEEIEKLKEKIKKIEAEITELEKTTATKMYIKELEELKL